MLILSEINPIGGKGANHPFTALRIAAMLYKDYLKSEQWLKFRKLFFSREHNKKCIVCGCTKNLNAHHMRYKSHSNNSILGKETESQVVSLCRECHHLWHKLSKQFNFNTKKQKRFFHKWGKLLKNNQNKAEALEFLIKRKL